jgi:Na+-translocating ferredoxin:NAD+ oxidoreductase RnfA subunit
LLSLNVSKTLFASLVFLLFSSTLHAKYLHLDEVIKIDKFTTQVEKLGEELYQATGVSLYLVTINTRAGKPLVVIEKEIANSLEEPFIMLTFAQGSAAGEQGKIDIIMSAGMEEHFDKEQVLSPYPWSGTIVPLLTAKIKQDVREKYMAALYNGYSDIAEQVADSYEKTLSLAAGNTNKVFVNTLRTIFWGIILLALFYYIYKKFKRSSDE